MTPDCILTAVSGFFNHGFSPDHMKGMNEFRLMRMEVVKVTDIYELEIPFGGLVDLFVYTQDADGKAPMRNALPRPLTDVTVATIHKHIDAAVGLDARRVAIFLTYDECDVLYSTVICCELMPHKATLQHLNIDNINTSLYMRTGKERK